MLGVINTWQQVSRSRVRLRVVPKIAIMMGRDAAIASDRTQGSIQKLALSGHRARLCIEVVNLSIFPVTIHDVGFGRVEGRRHCIVNPELTAGKEWPVRLESREAVTAYGATGELSLEPEIVKDAVAYAETDCGKVAYGTSPIFKEYVRRLHRKSEES